MTTYRLRKTLGLLACLSYNYVYLFLLRKGS
jgi:hypothetical protein